MSSRTANFCIDAADPYSQTQWWAQVLEDFNIDPEDLQEPGDDECGLAGPDGRWLLFLKVPEAKRVKNRMHICLRPVDRSRDEEVDRLLGLGATMVSDLRSGPDSGWVVLVLSGVATPEDGEAALASERPPVAVAATLADLVLVP